MTNCFSTWSSVNFTTNKMKALPHTTTAQHQGLQINLDFVNLRVTGKPTCKLAWNWDQPQLKFLKTHLKSIANTPKKSKTHVACVCCLVTVHPSTPWMVTMWTSDAKWTEANVRDVQNYAVYPLIYSIFQWTFIHLHVSEPIFTSVGSLISFW